MSLDQDVKVKFGGKEYTLRLTNLAIARFEEMTDKTFLEWGANLDNPSFGDLLALLWAGLQKHHKGITYEALGEDMITPAELMNKEMMAAFIKLAKICFGQDDNVEELNKEIEKKTGDASGESLAETG